MDLARDGDERAFEVIYDRHHRAILAFCRHMLGSREEAEDAVQHTFMAAHGSMLRSHREIALKAWLYTIARNRCLSVLRGRREDAVEDPELSTAGLSEQVERREDLRGLLADMADLPEQQRAALVLSELGDLSHAEIAGVLDCEAAQVKSFVFQARSSLIESKRAREIPCAEIREQLATLSGGALRRRPLRRHLAVCEGCREFREDVRSQRAMLAAVLPVAPTLGLKETALAAFGLGAGGASAGGGVAKLAVVVAVAAGGAGGAAVVDRPPAADRAQGPPDAVVAPAFDRSATPAVPGRAAPNAAAPVSSRPVARRSPAASENGVRERSSGKRRALGHSKPGHATPGPRTDKPNTGGPKKEAAGPSPERGNGLAVERGEGKKLGLRKERTPRAKAEAVAPPVEPQAAPTPQPAPPPEG